MGAQATCDAPADLEKLELRRPMLVSEFSRPRAELEAQGIEVVVPFACPRAAPAMFCWAAAPEDAAI